jgi:hypothetical protein
MHIPTGEFVEARDRDEARALLELKLARQVEADEIVMIDGNLQQVQELGDRVRLGAAEQDRRRKRRKDQAAARRRNR